MSGFIDDSEFLTVSDQTSRLTKSRRVAAGSHITLDSTVPGVLTVNSPRTFGTATLASGTATVSTTAASTTAVILLTHKGTGTSANFGVLSRGAVVAGTSFVINSSNASDDDAVFWELIEP